MLLEPDLCIMKVCATYSGTMMHSTCWLVGVACGCRKLLELRQPQYQLSNVWYITCKSILSWIPYILESNPHPFYSFRGLNNQMRTTVACGLDSQLRAGFWKNDRAAVHAIRTIQYSTIIYFIYYLLL